MTKPPLSDAPGCIPMGFKMLLVIALCLGGFLLL